MTGNDARDKLFRHLMMLQADESGEYENHNTFAILSNPLIVEIKNKILKQYSRRNGYLTFEDLSSLMDREIYRLAKQYASHDVDVFLSRVESSLTQLVQNELKKSGYYDLPVQVVEYTNENQLWNLCSEEAGYHKVEFWESVKSYLTDEEFELLHKFFVEGYLQREIAKEKGVSQQWISYRLQEIYKKLSNARELLD